MAVTSIIAGWFAGAEDPVVPLAAGAGPGGTGAATGLAAGGSGFFVPHI
jgi:hypothetical protein